MILPYIKNYFPHIAILTAKSGKTTCFQSNYYLTVNVPQIEF